MVDVQARNSSWIVALFAAITLFFASLAPATAAEPIIDQSGTSVSFKPTSTKDTYSLQVTGKTLTDTIKSITIAFGESSYKATFKPKTKTFTLSKNIRISSNVPSAITIKATDKNGKSDEVELPLPLTLVNEASVEVVKKTFINKELYYYEISGKVVTDEISSLLVTVGDTEKKLDIKNGAFKAVVFEESVGKVSFIAKSSVDAKKVQQFEIKVK